MKKACGKHHHHYYQQHIGYYYIQCNQTDYNFCGEK